MNNYKLIFLPQAGDSSSMEEVLTTQDEIQEKYPCPCCEKNTIPNRGDALAYICPVCLWEIDLFLRTEDEPSDQNHGLTLNEARNNYKIHGAILPALKKYSRLNEDTEYNEKG